MGMPPLASLLTVTVLCCLVSANLEVSIYRKNLETFMEIEDAFVKAVSEKVTAYCAIGNNCPVAFQSGNLTTEITDREDFKPNVNVTIVIMSENDDKLPVKNGKEAFKEQVDSINSDIDAQIVSVNEEFFGIKPDDPTNWIMISVFAIITLALLFVVIYLSKHKVNHVEEHYEQMNEKPASADADADGEVAA